MAATTPGFSGRRRFNLAIRSASLLEQFVKLCKQGIPSFELFLKVGNPRLQSINRNGDGIVRVFPRYG